jgi:hypothetical protein
MSVGADGLFMPIMPIMPIEAEKEGERLRVVSVVSDISDPPLSLKMPLLSLSRAHALPKKKQF